MVKNVYVAMSADVLHNGHINIIKEAAKFGVSFKMEQLDVDTIEKRENVSQRVNSERMKSNPVDLRNYTNKIFRLLKL